MARTNEDAVGAVIDIDVGDDVQPYIDTANSLVTELCSDSGYSDGRLELIERWLSAHFYDINRPRSQREGVSPGPFQALEPVKVDLFFNNTKYGQQAVLLDTAGNLAGLQNTLTAVKQARTAESKWLGWED